MKDEVTKARAKRLWLLFVFIWLPIFGFRALLASDEAKMAHNSAQYARVGGNILEGVTGEEINPYDPTYGAEVIAEKEQAETSTQEAYEEALWWLIGGLLAGTVAIWGGYWVMVGNGDGRR